MRTWPHARTAWSTLEDGRIGSDQVLERLVRARRTLALGGLTRSPGRTRHALLVLAAAVALLGSMMLFIGRSLRTMTAAAVRSVPLDWQGPVGSYRQAQAVSPRRRPAARASVSASPPRRPRSRGVATPGPPGLTSRAAARCSRSPPATSHT